MKLEEEEEEGEEPWDPWGEKGEIVGRELTRTR